MEGEVTTSSTDLVSMLPADIFSGSDVGDTSADTDISAVGEEFDIPAQDEGVEAAAEEAPAEAQEQPAEEVQGEAQEKPQEQSAATEDLPEGVRYGKDRNGKDGVWVEKSRWENAIHPHHKLFNEASAVIGEPLTVQALELRDRALAGQERLYGDLLSGDPKAQATVVGHFFQEAKSAIERGDVQSDPMVPFADVFYGALREQSPDGYAKLRTTAAKDLGEELYGEAAQMARAGRSDDATNLYRAIGRVLATVGLPYRKELEREGYLSSAGQQDESVSLRTRIQELEGQLSGRSTQNQTAQFESWAAETQKATTESVVKEAILPALTETETAWSKLKGGKEAFDDLVLGRLKSAVFRSMKQDKRFEDRINLLDEQAKRASAQRRAEIAGQIKQAFVNRAQLAVEAHKREVLDFAARTFKEKSNENHKRLAAGQNQRTPTGTHTPAPRGITPPAKSNGGGFFDADAEVRKWSAIING